MSREKTCPITNAPCRTLDCDWYIVDYDEDVPGRDYSDCAITNSCIQIDCLGYELDELRKAVDEIRRMLHEQERAAVPPLPI